MPHPEVFMDYVRHVPFPRNYRGKLTPLSKIAEIGAGAWKYQVGLNGVSLSNLPSDKLLS